MRYITHYCEYPIYEPAEGGYCYAGNQVVESERMSKRACKKELEKIWEEAKAENVEMYGSEIPGDHDEYGNRIYPWLRIETTDSIRIVRYSKYIGEGESFIIERRQGSEERGQVPYC